MKPVPRSSFALLAAVASLVLMGCSLSTSPDTLPRGEQGSAELTQVSAAPDRTLAPVTTAPRPPTTSGVPQSTSPAGSDEERLDTPTTTQELPMSNLRITGERLQSLLGPTDDLGRTIRSINSIPAGVATPDDAEIVEVSIGTGPPTEEGTAVTQVAVSLTTTLPSTTAFNQMAASLQAVGMIAVDSTDGDVRSGSFRLPSVDFVEEFVVTTAPRREGSTMRLTSNSMRPLEEVELLLDWADGPLPLPDSDIRTLIVVSVSGSDRLRTVNLTVESTALVVSRSPQREADRLISKVDSSDRFGFDGDPGVDPPLAGPLRFDGLDSLDYSVGVSSQTRVNEDGEPIAVEIVEIRLRGSLRLPN